MFEQASSKKGLWRVLAIAAAIVIFALSLSLAGCGGSEAPESETTPESSSDAPEQSETENNENSEASEADRTTLIVGFDQNLPPFGYIGDDGEFTGFDLEMAKAVADMNGWEVKYQPIDWNAKDAEINSGNIDCIWNGFTIQGREDDYTFTKPYMDNSQVIVARADSGIETFDDLAGKSVLAQVDSAAEDLLKNDFSDLAATFASLTSVSDYQTAFLDLESGAVDAIAMDSTVASFQTAGRESEFTILDEVLSEEDYGVGFKKGNTELRDIVEDSLMKLNEDGTFEELSIKYFGVNVSTL